MRKRNIKHNNLLPWFTDDHGTLPASYLNSCEKFFKELIQKRIRENMGLEPGEVDDGWPAGRKKVDKQQAPSNKPQAASVKQQALDKPGL